MSIVGTRTWPGADWVSSEWRIGEIELVRILRRDQRRVQQEGTAHGRLASELAGGHVNCRLDHGRWVRCGDRRTLVALLYHLDDLLHAVATECILDVGATGLIDRLDNAEQHVVVVRPYSVDLRILGEIILHQRECLVLVPVGILDVEDLDVGLGNHVREALYALALLRQGTRETDEEGRALFERALELDSHYARAYVGLSLSWFNEWGYQFWDRFQESWQTAYGYAHTALDLDDNDAMAHLVLGRLLIFDRNFERAAWYLDRALMLCPNDAELLIQQAINAVFLGHPESAVEYAQKALRLNPYHRNSYYAVLALAYLMARDFEATLLTMGKISQMSEHAQLIEAPAYTAIVYAKLGQMEEARQQFALFQSNFRQSIIGGREPEPGEACRWFLQNIPYRRQEDIDFLADGFRLFDGAVAATRGDSLPAAKPQRQDEQSFVRQGNIWLITFSRRQISLPDMKGLRDIQRLIERAGEEIHCLDLAERGEDSYGGDVMLDDKARTALKRRIRDLQEELAEAQDMNDLGQAARLRGELDQLIDTLASALGLGGRSRRIGSLAERARTTVTWRIRHALRKIEAVHEPLAKHLTNSLRTGTFCSYQPEQVIEWQLASGG